MTIPAYHLPSHISGFETEPLSFGEVTLEVPRVTPALLTGVMRHLETAGERLRKRKRREIVEILSAAFARLRDRSDSLRQTAEEALPAITRFSPAMVVHGLDLLCAGYGTDGFYALLQEAGVDTDLNEFVPRGSHLSRAFAPALTTHVLAGNIPGVGFSGLVAATLAGTASLVKTASGDPLSPALWATSLSRQDPEVGECVAVLWWRGGLADLEAVAFDGADVVVAYGSDKTMRDLQGRVRPRFLGHGHRVSLGVIGREVLGRADEVAEQAAYDASLFDQQGCLSPHCFYVEEGGAVSPKEFAELLGSAMATWAERLPPGPLTRGEAAAVRKFRAGYEAQRIAGKDIALFLHPQGLDWAVIFDPDPSFTLSCLHRTVVVKPVPDLSEVGGPLRPWGPYLQAAGVAVAPERTRMLANALGQAGVNRVCPIGKMQAPPLTWYQDGRFLLRDLLRWTDLEV